VEGFNLDLTKFFVDIAKLLFAIAIGVAGFLWRWDKMQTKKIEAAEEEQEKRRNAADKELLRKIESASRKVEGQLDERFNGNERRIKENALTVENHKERLAAADKKLALIDMHLANLPNQKDISELKVGIASQNGEMKIISHTVELIHESMMRQSDENHKRVVDESLRSKKS